MSFTSGHNSDHCPIVGKCGHSMCAECIQRYKDSLGHEDLYDDDGNPVRDEQGYPVRVPLENPPKDPKIQCYNNCCRPTFNREIRKYEQRPIKDAFWLEQPHENLMLSQALEVLQDLRKKRGKLRGKQATNNHESFRKEIETIAADPNAFDKCFLCHQEFSATLDKEHERAPLVGFCGHTACHGCLMKAYREENQGRKLYFSCPFCRQPDRFKNKDLIVNIRFRAALQYWNALKDDSSIEGGEEYYETNNNNTTNPFHEQSEELTETAATTDQDSSSLAGRIPSPPRPKIKQEESVAPRIKQEDPAEFWTFSFARNSDSTYGSGPSHRPMVAIKTEDNIVCISDDDDDDDDSDDGNNGGEVPGSYRRDRNGRLVFKADPDQHVPPVITNRAINNSRVGRPVAVKTEQSVDTTTPVHRPVAVRTEQLVETTPVRRSAGVKTEQSVDATAETYAAHSNDGATNSHIEEEEKKEEGADEEMFYNNENGNQPSNDIESDDSESVIEIPSDDEEDAEPAQQEVAEDVVELLDSDDDDDDDDDDDAVVEVSPPNKRARYLVDHQRLNPPHPSNESGEFASLRPHFNELEFLCYDEFRDPREWHVFDKEGACVRVVKDKSLRETLGESLYIYIFQRSMSKHFRSLCFEASTGTWSVKTDSDDGTSRGLDDPFVFKNFRPEFLEKVIEAPSVFHEIKPWCRVFPSTTVRLPHKPSTDYFGDKNFRPGLTARPSPYSAHSMRFPVIPFPLDQREISEWPLDPIRKWKLLFAFASALCCMPGRSEQAQSLFNSGAADDPSDDNQITRLQELVKNHVPGSCLEPADKSLAVSPPPSTLLVVMPKLARCTGGAHVQCFLVIYRDAVFEPTLPRALLLNGANLGRCCGGLGEFKGARKCWKLTLEKPSKGPAGPNK